MNCEILNDNKGSMFEMRKINNLPLCLGNRTKRQQQLPKTDSKVTLVLSQMVKQIQNRMSC